MATIPIWQKSKTERAAAFAKAFAGMTPAKQPAPPIAQQLRLVRPLILKMQREGFEVAQICEGLKHEDIGINASIPTLRRMLAAEERKREQRRNAHLAALMPKQASASSKAPTPQSAGAPRP